MIARIHRISGSPARQRSHRYMGIAIKPRRSSQDGLLRLPLELLVRILEQLPNLSSILSAILTHSLIYKAFTEYESQIPLTVFGRKCNEVKGSELSHLFWELVFAVRHDFVKRDSAERIFILGWQVFRQRCAEELLIPVGRALAWSLCLDNRDQHAINLLEKIAHSDAPFDHRFRGIKFHSQMSYHDFQRMWPKITLLPMFRLLADLKRKPNIFPSQGLNFNDEELQALELGRQENICLAEIGENGIRVLESPRNDPLRDQGNAVAIMTELRDGIQFSSRKAIVGMVNPGRLPCTTSPLLYENESELLLSKVASK